MATDKYVSQFTAETVDTLDSTEQVILFDTVEGKRVTVAALGDYIINHLSITINGTTQTVAQALASLQ